MRRIMAMVTGVAVVAAWAPACDSGGGGTPAGDVVEAADASDAVEVAGDPGPPGDPQGEVAPHDPGPPDTLEPADPASEEDQPDLIPEVGMDAPPEAEVPALPACCATDEECGEDLTCVGADLEGGGVCLPRPTGGLCYDWDDCPDLFFCFDARPCSCTMGCISEPGTCAPMPGDCCEDDGDCKGGRVCVDEHDGMGVCQVPPGVGQCWEDADCDPNEACYGAFVCPCDADCADPDRFGTCAPVGICCDHDTDCGPDRVCGAFNTCQPTPAAGRCWDHDDCYETQACEGSSECPCGSVCILISAPGFCTPLPAGAATPMTTATTGWSAGAGSRSTTCPGAASRTRTVPRAAGMSPAAGSRATAWPGPARVRSCAAASNSATTAASAPRTRWASASKTPDRRVEL